MAEILHTPLEACGWFVRTQRTAGAGTGWLVADCSDGVNGAAYARLFAAAPELRDSLKALLAELMDIEVLGEWEALDINTSSRKKVRARVDAIVAQCRAALIKATVAPPEPIRHIRITGDAL